MDQLHNHLDKTFSARLVMDLKEIAYGTGLISLTDDNKVQRKPLYHWLLRVQDAEVPKTEPFQAEPDGQWLTMIEGPVHWEHIENTKEDKNEPPKFADAELGKHDVLLSVLRLSPFIIMKDAVEDAFKTLLLAEGREPYFVDEEKGFKYYDIPIDDALQRVLQPTQKFGAMGDLYRGEWLWENHPAYSEHRGTPLLTGAFVGGYNPKTHKGEIYFAIYRGQVNVAVGGTLRFWEQDLTILDTGLLVRKGKNLMFAHVPQGEVQTIDMSNARNVYQFSNSKHLKAFYNEARKSPLGAWHVSLQFDGKTWYGDGVGRTLSGKIEKRIMEELAVLVENHRKQWKALGDQLEEEIITNFEEEHNVRVR